MAGNVFFGTGKMAGKVHEKAGTAQLLSQEETRANIAGWAAPQCRRGRAQPQRRGRSIAAGWAAPQCRLGGFAGGGLMKRVQLAGLLAEDSQVQCAAGAAPPGPNSATFLVWGAAVSMRLKVLTHTCKMGRCSRPGSNR